MNGDVCFFRFGPPKFPRWEVVNGFFPSFCGLQNFEVRSDEFSLLVFILDQLNFEAKTSELSFLFPALWACKSSRWEPLVNWISHCLHFGRPNFSGQNEWMKFPVHFIGASEILRWKLVNSWFLHFGPPKFWGEKSWMEFPGSFTLGLQSFEAKTSELNFPVSFYFGPGWPGYFGSERQWVSCFLFPSLWAFFFRAAWIATFYFEIRVSSGMKNVGFKSMVHHIASYDVIWWAGAIIWWAGAIIWWAGAIIWWVWPSYCIIWCHMMGGGFCTFFCVQKPCPKKLQLPTAQGSFVFCARTLAKRLCRKGFAPKKGPMERQWRPPSP